MKAIVWPTLAIASGEEGREVSAATAVPLKAVNGVDNVSEALGYSSS